jgi:hypothetical protein
MTSQTTAMRQLQKHLIEDNPGEHVYRFACASCGRECGPEFTVPHASSGRTGDRVPVVVAECACGVGAEHRCAVA